LLYHTSRSHRRGSVLTESAIVLPIFFMLMIGAITTGLGISYYQRVALLSREGARWASVHGGWYANDFNTSNGVTTYTTKTDVYNNAITTMATGLVLSPNNCVVTWDDPVFKQTPGTNVTVTVSYTWVPILYLETMTLSSTSKMVISY
jgi:Flp pilus assembly protein TadG